MEGTPKAESQSGEWLGSAGQRHDEPEKDFGYVSLK